MGRCDTAEPQRTPDNPTWPEDGMAGSVVPGVDDEDNLQCRVTINNIEDENNDGDLLKTKMESPSDARSQFNNPVHDASSHMRGCSVQVCCRQPFWVCGSKPEKGMHRDAITS
jgi:hypothetical protein